MFLRNNENNKEEKCVINIKHLPNLHCEAEM